MAFDVKDSLVSRKTTGFGIKGAGIDEPSPSSVSFTEVDENWRRDRPTEPVTAGWITTERFRYYQFVVQITPKVTTSDRKRYSDFDYGCLWRYHGCKDARELLPSADRFPENKFNCGSY